MPVGDLLAEWAYVEPTTKEVAKMLDRCAHRVMEEFDWLTRPSAEATEHLRARLAKIPGYLPSWMEPSFWAVDYGILPVLSSPTLIARSRTFMLLPTCLLGERIEFHAEGPEAVRASLPHKDLFVVGEDRFDALIGLARLFLSQMEELDGTAP